MNNLTKSEKSIYNFETKTPKEYLSVLRFEFDPRAESIIEILRTKYNLNDIAINVVLDYTLNYKKNHHPFYWNSIVRGLSVRKIETAVSALKYIEEWEKENLKAVEFNNFDIRYMNKLWSEYDMDYAVSMPIVEYGKEVNQGLTINWFLDRVAEFVNKHEPDNREATEDLIRTFHEKYVVPFGR